MFLIVICFLEIVDKIICALFHELGLLNRHRFLLLFFSSNFIFAVFIVPSFHPLPTFTALFIATPLIAVIVRAVRVRAVAVAGLGYRLLDDWLQVFKKGSFEVFSQLSTFKYASYPLGLAKGKKLYLAQIKVLYYSIASVGRRNV